MKPRFTEAATEDLAEARTFVASTFGKQVRKGLNAELRRATTLLRERPFAGKSAGRTAREYVLNGYPYSLIYYVENDDIVVSAFYHHSRHPNVWQERFGPER